MQQNHKGAGMKFFIIAGESSGDVHGAVQAMIEHSDVMMEAF